MDLGAARICWRLLNIKTRAVVQLKSISGRSVTTDQANVTKLICEYL